MGDLNAYLKFRRTFAKNGGDQERMSGLSHSHENHFLSRLLQQFAYFLSIGPHYATFHCEAIKYPQIREPNYAHITLLLKWAWKAVAGELKDEVAFPMVADQAAFAWLEGWEKKLILWFMCVISPCLSPFPVITMSSILLGLIMLSTGWCEYCVLNE